MRKGWGKFTAGTCDSPTPPQIFRTLHYPSRCRSVFIRCHWVQLFCTLWPWWHHGRAAHNLFPLLLELHREDLGWCCPGRGGEGTAVGTRPLLWTGWSTKTQQIHRTSRVFLGDFGRPSPYAGITGHVTGRGEVPMLGTRTPEGNPTVIT